MEATAEACFEKKLFGGGRGRDNILSYVWDQIWQKLDKIALSNKKPVLTTSSNQLTKNKEINGWMDGLDCVPGSQLYFVRFRNGACKCFYVVIDFSLCNDERFRDLGSRLLTSGSFVNNFSVFRQIIYSGLSVAFQTISYLQYGG